MMRLDPIDRLGMVALTTVILASVVFFILGYAYGKASHYGRIVPSNHVPTVNTSHGAQCSQGRYPDGATWSVCFAPTVGASAI